MGLFDWLPCCGPRSSTPSSPPSAENAPLLAPPRDPSILSEGYGAADPALHQGQETLSHEQRRRIETIGREAGSQMLSIHRPSSGSGHRHPSGPSRNPSASHAQRQTSGGGPGLPKTDTIQSTTSTVDASGSSSVGSSRASSPSPMRHSVRKGLSGREAAAAAEEADGGEGEPPAADKAGEEAEEVVTKQVFMGMGGGAKRGRGRGRGRGRWRGK